MYRICMVSSSWFDGMRFDGLVEAVNKARAIARRNPYASVDVYYIAKGRNEAVYAAGLCHAFVTAKGERTRFGRLC